MAKKKGVIQIYRLRLIVQDSNDLSSEMCIRFETRGGGINKGRKTKWKSTNCVLSAIYSDECIGIVEAGKNAYATKYVEQSSHEVLTVTYAAQWTWDKDTSGGNLLYWRWQDISTIQTANSLSLWLHFLTTAMSRMSCRWHF